MRKPIVPPFNLIHNSGWSKEFGSIEELNDFCCKYQIIDVIGTHHYTETFFYHYDKSKGVRYHTYSYIIRDLYGQKITNEYLGRSRYRTKKQAYRDKQWLSTLDGGPVWGIGKKTYGATWRKNRHHSIQKQIEASLYNEDDVKINHRLNKKLPTAWDDNVRSNYDNRSWKKCRKTQWKNI